MTLCPGSCLACRPFDDGLIGSIMRQYENWVLHRVMRGEA